MTYPDFNTEIVPVEFFIEHKDFARVVIKNYQEAKELNCSWYGPKAPFCITRPMLISNANHAKISNKMEYLYGRDLEFITQIERDGKSVSVVSPDVIDVIQNHKFLLTCLSLNNRTYIASGFNVFVVKKKNKNEKK